jgi:hypothetical protein
MTAGSPGSTQEELYKSWDIDTEHWKLYELIVISMHITKGQSETHNSIHRMPSFVEKENKNTYRLADIYRCIEGQITAF